MHRRFCQVGTGVVVLDDMWVAAGPCVSMGLSLDPEAKVLITRSVLAVCSISPIRGYGEGGAECIVLDDAPDASC